MLDFDYFQNTIDASIFTYEKMLSTVLNKLGESSNHTDIMKVQDITALISFNGDVVGSMFITMNQGVALKTISKFIMCELTELNDDIYDGLEEIVNIIAGAAAARFNVKANLGLPTILLGENQRIRGTDDSPWKLQTVNSEILGPFTIGITLKEVK